MNRIKQLRKERHKTQKDVAAFIGMTEQAVANYETSQREPKLETWKKLASFFDVSVPYLQGVSNSNVTAETWEKFDKELNNDLNNRVSSLSDLSLENKLIIVSIVSFLKTHNESVTDKFYSFMTELLSGSELYEKIDRKKLNQLFNELLNALDQIK